MVFSGGAVYRGFDAELDVFFRATEGVWFTPCERYPYEGDGKLNKLHVILFLFFGETAVTDSGWRGVPVGFVFYYLAKQIASDERVYLCPTCTIVNYDEITRP